MNIKKEKEGNKLIVRMEGRLDTTTAPDLEAEIKKAVDSVNSIELDFKDLEYMSSAGIRVVLSTYKTMSKKGGLVIKNVNEVIMEVLEVTGMTDILTIEA